MTAVSNKLDNNFKLEEGTGLLSVTVPVLMEAVSRQSAQGFDR